MTIGTIEDLQRALGTRQNGEPTVSYFYAQSVKKAAGFTARLFDIDAAKRWLKDHPNHSTEDAWPRKKRAAGMICK